MLRRCALDLSSPGRSTGKYRGTIAARVPFFLSLRTASSSVPKPPQVPSTSVKPLNPLQDQGQVTEKSSVSVSVLPKLLLGGIVVGAAVIAANEAGYIKITRDRLGIEISPTLINKQEDDRIKHIEYGPAESDKKSTEHSLTKENTDFAKPDPVEEPEVNEHGLQGGISSHDESATSEDKTSLVVLQSDQLPASEQQMPVSHSFTVDTTTLENGRASTETSTEQKEDEATVESNMVVNQEKISPVNDDPATSVIASDYLSSKLLPQGPIHPQTEETDSLSRDYSLQEQVRYEAPENDNEFDFSSNFDKEPKLQDQAIKVNSSDSKSEFENEKIILDLIQTIHAAEKRQAESDFRKYEEEKRATKEKYEKDLKDARARQLMYAEEVALLDKELTKERNKTAATVKTLQEKAEQNLRTELQRKAEEMEKEIEKVSELAKAELNAALASEKSSHMEKIAEANLNINALCMAFYARSEEDRQNHSVHKLALGTLALEDALAKGFPIRSEVDALRACITDIKNDSLLELVLSSLPKETLDKGAITKSQLNQKFDSLKGTLRHFSLIPLGGGGLLTHTLAYIVSIIKAKESNASGDGIESVISRVDNLLAQGRLLEAADALEGGVSGTEAEGVIQEWVTQARNHVITEQALALLQSYATSVSLA